MLRERNSAAEAVSVPDLSVVVPSVNGWSSLAECLDALHAHDRGLDVEILVIDRCGEELRREIARRFAGVRVLVAAPDTAIPELRAMGFCEARGRSVAVIEDHVLVPSSWAARLVALQSAGKDVVGGSVSNAATERTVDWAAFLCEYSHLLPPLEEGPSEALTGNNTVYRRALLDRYRAEVRAGRWEDYLHRAMRRDGITLYCDPSIEVAHKMHYTVRSYLSQRFLYARSFAGGRLASTPLIGRVGYAAAACALPVVLVGRIVSRVMRKGTHTVELLKSLPLIGLFATGWAAGEIVGALAGPGDSLSRVR